MTCTSGAETLVPPLPPLPSPPAWLFVVLGFLTVGSAVVGAQFGDSEWTGRAAHDVFQGLCGVFAALLVGSGIVRYWQGKEWTKRTRYIALDLIGEAMRETAVIAAKALYVLGVERSLTTTDLAFSLPWTTARQDYAAALKEMAQSAVLEPFARSTSANDPALEAVFDQMDQRAMASAADLQQMADRQRQLIGELGPYVHGDAIALFDGAATVRTRAAQLIGPIPGRRVPGQTVTAKAAGDLLEACIEFAAIIGPEASRIREQLTPAQQEALAPKDAEAAEREAFKIQIEQAHRDIAAARARR